VRHQVYGRKLGRDITARKALLNNLAGSLFIKGQIITTLAKAKFARVHAEKLITNAKKNRLADDRLLASILPSEAFSRLRSEIGPGFKNRNGGYTRITKIMPRRGDAAEMAKLELVEWETQVVSKKSEKTKGSSISPKKSSSKKVSKKLTETKEAKRSVSKKKVATKKK